MQFGANIIFLSKQFKHLHHTYSVDIHFDKISQIMLVTLKDSNEDVTKTFPIVNIFLANRTGKIISKWQVISLFWTWRLHINLQVMNNKFSTEIVNPKEKPQSHKFYHQRGMLGEHEKSLPITSLRLVIYKLFECSPYVPSGLSRR